MVCIDSMSVYAVAGALLYVVSRLTTVHVQCTTRSGLIRVPPAKRSNVDAGRERSGMYLGARERSGMYLGTDYQQVSVLPAL